MMAYLDQFLDKSRYTNNISTSVDQYFTFLAGPRIRYRTCFRHAREISFDFAVQFNVKQVTPMHLNARAKAPYLVLVALEPTSPFSVLGQAISEHLGEEVDHCSTSGEAYLNASSTTFSKLQSLTYCGASYPQLYFSVTLRHIIFGDDKKPRLKFLLTDVSEQKPDYTNLGGRIPEKEVGAVDVESAPKTGAKRRADAPKKKDVKKLRVILPTETVQVEQDNIPQISIEDVEATFRAHQ
jgi:hypothetical protein